MIEFLVEPKTWRSAQLPVVFAFDYEIVLPSLDQSNPAWLGSHLIEPPDAQNQGMLQILSIPSVPFSVGQSFYVARGNSLLIKTPVTITRKGKYVFGNGDTYDAYRTDTPFPGGGTVDLYTLDFVERFNPAMLLYVDDAFATQIRYDRDLSGIYRLNLSPYLRPYFSDIGFPGRLAGPQPSLSHKYRLDWIVNGQQFAGKDRYVLNSMVQPGNPPCSDNKPVWITDMATIQCAQGGARTSSDRVAKQKDTNPGSPTFGLYRDSGAFFFYDSNADACPVTYLSAAVSQSFTRNNCTTGQVGGSVVHTIAAGAFTSPISQAAADQQAFFQLSQTGQAAANAGGICTAVSAGFEYRNQTQVFPAPGSVEIRADLWMVNPTGGIVTFYYTDTAKSDGVVTGTQTRTANMNGTQLLLLASVLLVQDTPTTPSITREFANIRLTP